MKFVGIDLAARADKTSICILDWRDNPVVESVYSRATDEQIICYAGKTATAVGIDSPFGWPSTFVSFVKHGLMSQPPQPLRSFESDRLRYRETDLWVREQFESRGKRVQPLSVSTDKLGAVALRCVRLVRCLAHVRGDRVNIFEIYPFASLSSWMRINGSYKRSSKDKVASRRLRESIVSKFTQHGVVTADFHTRLIDSDHDLDALICALTAALAYNGQTYTPPGEKSDLAELEGWIHVPSGTLRDVPNICFQS